MNIAIALVLGLLIGWLVEWVIDWFYWRRPREDKKDISASAPVKTQKIRYKTAPAHADDLKKIKGIGPVIAKRLNTAGIYTYEQLADLTLDEFEEALGDLLQRFINERAILRHARELAEQKSRRELK
jgi:predicted flap endonuclease-1-like 5' DNA nuclease